jgi:UDP-MurNAc hydroxylase
MTNKGLSVEFVSHASVVIRSADTAIWTDPWLFGSAFNNSWELLGPTPTPPSDLDRIPYIWISHEHPDHFHIPTLRSLPESFKNRVTILFQSSNSRKVFDAFVKMGYPNHLELHSRQVVQLPASNCRIYCYPVGQMDSVLGVCEGGASVLDVNDSELDGHDCGIIRREFGPPTAVLNQFSIAGYSGMPDAATRLDAMSERILQKVSQNHRDLGASVTVPIASFIYYSRTDNAYINPHANRPSDVVRYLGRRGQDVVVLGPGDAFAIGAPHDSSAAIAMWDREFDALRDRDFAPSDRTELDEIEASFHDRVRDMKQKFPSLVMRALKPLVVCVCDLDVRIRMCFGSGTFEVNPDGAMPTDVEMNSQPLWFMLSQPFGMQTLGTSARYRITEEQCFRNWRRHRILFALDNAEFYLRPHRLISRANIDYLRARYTVLPRQISYQLARMR